MAGIDPQVVRERLVAMRKAAHLTQAQLAAEIGVAPSTVSSYELGAHEPDLTTIAAWVRACRGIGDLILLPARAPALDALAAAAQSVPSELADLAARALRALSALPLETISEEVEVLELRTGLKLRAAAG